MAPAIQRGKIRAQVFGDVSVLLFSFAIKVAEAVGLIGTATNGRPGGGGGISALGNNDR